MKSVNDMTSDAMIGPNAKTTRPISQGPMKTKPQNASRRDAEASQRRRARGWAADEALAPSRLGHRARGSMVRGSPPNAERPGG